MNIVLAYSIRCSLIFFFFQAEDGIRDLTVTGVQTCALPISHAETRDVWISATGISTRALPRPPPSEPPRPPARPPQIGRASCRERVEISVVAVSLKKKKEQDKFEDRVINTNR